MFEGPAVEVADVEGEGSEPGEVLESVATAVLVLLTGAEGARGAVEGCAEVALVEVEGASSSSSVL
jgi:hypothetical protein